MTPARTVLLRPSAAMIAAVISSLALGLMLSRSASADTPVFRQFLIDPCLAAGGGAITQQSNGATIFTNRPSFSVMLTTVAPSNTPTGLNGTCATLPEPNANNTAIQGLWEFNGNGTDASSAHNDLSFAAAAYFVNNAPSLRNLTQSFGPKTSDNFETGDFSSFPWSLSGSSAIGWQIQSGGSGGSWSARSGAISHSASSCMDVSLNVKAAGNVTFDYNVDSEPNFDFLRFFIDQAEPAGGQWSGTTNWQPASFPVSTGVHNFKWCYIKDGGVSAGSDKAAVDNIVFPFNLPIANTGKVIPLNNTDFTVETWYRWIGRNPTNDFQTILLNCQAPAQDQCLHIGIGDNGKPEMDFQSDDLASDTAVNDGTWHHLAFVLTSTAKSIFIDGVRRNGTTSGTQAVYAGAAQTIFIGGANNWGSLNGSLNSLRVYRRALSIPEIQAHAKGQIFKIHGDDSLDGNLSGAYCTSVPGVGANNWQWGFGRDRTLPTGAVSFEFAALGADETFGGNSASITVDQTKMASPPLPNVSNVDTSNASWTVPAWFCDAHAANPNTNVHYTVNRDWTTPLTSYPNRTYAATGLTPNTRYGVDFQATYVDASPGSGVAVGPSPRTLTVSATTLANVPGAPTGAFTSGTAITLTVPANGNPNGSGGTNATQYQIQAARNAAIQAGNYTAIGDWSANPSLSLLNSSSYTFRALARNANDIETAPGPISAAVYVTQPNPPTALQGTPASGGYCPKTDIQWSWTNAVMGSGAAAQSNLYDSVGSGSSGLQSAASYVKTGLAPGTQYGAFVRAYDSGASTVGNDNRYSSPSAIAYASTLPAATVAPTGLAGTPQTNAVLWNWTAPPICAGGEYQVINAVSGALITSTPLPFTAPTPPFTQSGLGPNVLSSIQVQARDNIDRTWSSLSNSATTYTLAATPVWSPFASISTGGFVATWSANGNPGYTRYELTYTADPSFLVGVSTRVGLADNFTGASVGVTDLAPGTTYYVRLRAFNGRGSDAYGGLATPSSASSVVTVPSAPSLAGTPLSNSSIQWTWSSVTGAAGYTLYDSASPTVLYGPSASALSFISSALSVNARYDAEVRADAPSPTPSSARSHAFTYTMANPPVAPLASAVYATSATFTWGSNGNPGYTFYRVLVSTDSLFAVVTATLTVTAPTATATGLLPGGVTYYAQVQAVNGAQLGTAYVGLPAKYTTLDPSISVSSAPASPYVAPAGLAGSWQFDEDSGTTTADGSGNANIGNFGCATASCVSTPTFASGPSGLGSAASFSGQSGGVVLTANAGPPSTAGSVTVEAWVNPATAAQTAGAGITTKGRKNSEDFALDVSASGAFEFLASNTSIAATAAITAGRWTHVVGVYDSAHTSATLYVNGAAVATNTSMPARANSAEKLAIGNRQDAAGQYTLPFAGRIDAVRVVAAALTAPQVMADYLGSFVSSVTAPSPNNGIIVALPPNAFGAPAQIFISTDPVNHPIRISASALNAGLAVTPLGLTLVPNSLVEVVPVIDGAAFTSPLGSSATLTIPYHDPGNTGLIAGTNPPLTAAGLRMYTLNTAVNSWTLLPTAVDRTGHTVSGVTPHFSVFALFAPSTVAASLSGVKAYPTPWKPGSGGRFDAPGVTFANLPASGTIRILTLSGQRVKDIAFNGASSGLAVWDGLNEDGRRTASGVYFARVASGVDGSAAWVKFAIER